MLQSTHNKLSLLYQPLWYLQPHQRGHTQHPVATPTLVEFLLLLVSKEVGDNGTLQLLLVQQLLLSSRRCLLLPTQRL